MLWLALRIYSQSNFELWRAIFGETAHAKSKQKNSAKIKAIELRELESAIESSSNMSQVRRYGQRFVGVPFEVVEINRRYLTQVGRGESSWILPATYLQQTVEYSRTDTVCKSHSAVADPSVHSCWRAVTPTASLLQPTG